MKLAEALLRRKELQDKIPRIKSVKESDIFELRTKRINVTDGVDEVTAAVPKLSHAQVDSEYNFYAKQLRLLDALIQQANWTTELCDEHGLTEDYQAPASA